MRMNPTYDRSSPQLHLLGAEPGATGEYNDGLVDLTSGGYSRQQFAHHTFMLIKKAGASGVLSVQIQVSPYDPTSADFDATSHWVTIATLTNAAPIARFENAVLPYVRAVRAVELAAVEAKVVVCSANHRG